MSIRISTWNCFGMGQGWSAIRGRRAPFAERFLHHRVLSECEAPDVLCVQELLSREAQHFFDRLAHGRFVSRIRDDNRIRFGGRMTMRGSGLGIGARTALSRAVGHTFTGARTGWDRLARKGALYVQVSPRPGLVIDLITVHLQAGYDLRAGAVRAMQLADLRAFVESVGSPERPFVVCGDLNIDGLAHRRDGAEYQSLLAALDGFEDLGAAADQATFEPLPNANRLAYALEPDAAPQRIDYILFRPAQRGAVELRCERLDVFFDKPLDQSSRPDAATAWASDHYGLCATFRG